MLIDDVNDHVEKRQGSSTMSLDDQNLSVRYPSLCDNTELSATMLLDLQLRIVFKFSNLNNNPRTVILILK